MNDQQPLARKHYKPPFKLYTVFPSVADNLLSSMLFLVFYLPLSISLFMPTAESSMPLAQQVMLFSFIMQFVSFIMAKNTAATILRFGNELYDYALYPPERLLRLGFRCSVIPIVTVLIVGPALSCLLIKTVHNMPVSHCILIGVASSATHLMFMVWAAYNVMDLEPNTTLRRFTGLLFPIGYILVAGLIIFILTMAANITSHFIPMFRAFMNDIWFILGNAANTLYQIPVLGPLVMFCLNPYYVLSQVFTPDNYTITAGLAYIAATSLAIFAMSWRLKTYAFQNWDDRVAKLYEMQKSVMANYTSGIPTEFDRSTSPSERPEQETPIRQVQGTKLTLPNQTAVEFLNSFYDSAPWKSKNLWYVMVFLGISSLITPWTILVAWLTWMGFTNGNMVIPIASRILPLPVWSLTRHYFRRSILPLLPFDFIISLTAIIIIEANLRNVIWFLNSLFLTRINILIIRILSGYQAKIRTLASVIPFAIVFLINVAALTIPESDRLSLKEYALIFFIPYAATGISWIMMAIHLKSRYNNLAHYQPI